MTDRYLGHPVYIVKEGQKRKHRKKRINKKWLKRYGCYEFIANDQVVIMNDGTICMTKKTWEKLRKELAEQRGSKDDV